MARILGLDLGARGVKAVLLESTFRGFTVAEVATAEHAPAEPPREPVTVTEAAPAPPAAFAKQLATLKEVLITRRWHPDLVVLSWPGASAAIQVVTLPFTDSRRIEQTVQFEVEGQMPFDLADAAWDWQPIGVREIKAEKTGEEAAKAQHGTDLLVAVVRREELKSLIDALAGVGIDPRVVVPAGPAYASLFGAGVVVGDGPLAPGAPSPEAGADIVLDLGEERTSICVVVNGQCEAARTFAGGTRQIARSVARSTGIDEKVAAALLGSDGASGEHATAVQQGLLPIVRELRATLRAWQSRVKRPIRRLFLAGAGGQIAGLPELLEPEVQAPVEPLAFTGPAAVRIRPDEAPGLALALSLALRGHQSSRAPRLNLRRGDLAFVKDFQHLKGKIQRLVAYAALLLILAGVSAWAKVFALSRQEQRLDTVLCDTTQKVIGKCYPDPDQTVSILKGKGTPSAAIPKVSAANLFAELAQRVPTDVTLKFERIDITREKLHLQGITDSAENVDKIVSALRTSRCFTDARSGGARKRPTDQKFEFSIDSGLTCETPPPPGGGRG